MCGNCVQSLHFRSEEYLEGTGHKARLGEEAAKEDQGFFWEYFRKWRERTQISGQEQEEIIQKLEQWTKKRVAGIMENNRRNYYGECAAFVAALGEVKESRGEPGAKQRTLEAYRSAYSRRRAFHQELRNYGMY